MPPIQRVTEIFENLFVLEKDLVGELLAELALCDPAELVQLFGSPLRTSDQRRAPQVRATAPEVPTAPPAEQPAPQVAPRDPYAGWQWDERGYRISPKGQSAFAWNAGRRKIRELVRAMRALARQEQV
jgi:hypothetical protein